MPKATVSLTTERFELKSLPEGYVVLKRMSYGDKLYRLDMMKLSLEMNSKSKDIVGEMAMGNQKVTQYEFINCIVEHNLEDENGQPLNFANEVHFKTLDPRIGEEINTLIEKMNNFSEDEGNS